MVLRATFEPENDVKDVLANIQLRGYQVQYDELAREAVIRK